MKASEKSLELNVGAELLGLFRRLFSPKAYLIGLTQLQESLCGVDQLVALTPSARVYAFQFKAPRARRNSLPDILPYRFTIGAAQHGRLYRLAQSCPDSVFYVFPFFDEETKLYTHVPNLLGDTWFLPVATMTPNQVFSGKKSKVVRCVPGLASVNPEFEMWRIDPRASGGEGFRDKVGNGIPIERLLSWLEDVRSWDRPTWRWEARRLPTFMLVDSA